MWERIARALPACPVHGRGSQRPLERDTPFSHITRDKRCLPAIVSTGDEVNSRVRSAFGLHERQQPQFTLRVARENVLLSVQLMANKRALKKCQENENQKVR